jgi:hypothetical protein
MGSILWNNTVWESWSHEFDKAQLNDIINYLSSTDFRDVQFNPDTYCLASVDYNTHEFKWPAVKIPFDTITSWNIRLNERAILTLRNSNWDLVVQFTRSELYNYLVNQDSRDMDGIWHGIEDLYSRITPHWSLWEKWNGKFLTKIKEAIRTVLSSK